MEKRRELTTNAPMSATVEIASATEDDVWGSLRRRLRARSRSIPSYRAQLRPPD